MHRVIRNMNSENAIADKSDQDKSADWSTQLEQHLRPSPGVRRSQSENIMSAFERQSEFHQELHGRVARRVEGVDKQFVSGEAAVPVVMQEDPLVGHPPHLALLNQETLR